MIVFPDGSRKSGDRYSYGGDSPPTHIFSSLMYVLQNPRRPYIHKSSHGGDSRSDFDK